MKAPKTAGTAFLGMEHAAAMQCLVTDPVLAATTRLPNPYPPNGAFEFIEISLAEREIGRTQVLAILDRNQFVGLCGLHGIEPRGDAELGYWIGRPHWGRGFATFGVQMAVELAFRNLQLTRVHADVLERNLASRRVLEKNGFRCIGCRRHAEPQWDPAELVAQYELTPGLWREHLQAPDIAALTPLLRAILEVELAAGNEVVETGRGWPDQDSIFVRLKEPFRHRRTALPEGVRFTELNDPHWWHAEFATTTPRHILAY